ncbi:MAG TPA: class I SAM-dependent methyltransferase, partial [Chloroflexota bacterium]|nr:class I SAM-dependent methyltransferase [Chloroflexota bacterium]
MPDKAGQWQKMFDYLLGYQAVWVTDVGLKSGLLAAIAEREPVTETALREALDMDARYLGVWCRAAYAYELVEYEEAGGYRLAPHLRDILLEPADPQFLGGRLQFYAALYEDFKAFPGHLKAGGSWARAEHDPWLLEALGNMTKPDAPMIVQAVLPQSPATLKRLEAAGGSILDVGAGTGFAVIHYARRFPKAQVLGLESDVAMVHLGREAVVESGLANATLAHGDANQLAAHDAYDLVTMNVALHETGGPAEWRNVLRRVHAALKPGGTLIVSELPYPDDLAAYRQQPVYKALAGVQFHETLVGCGAITQHTLAELLREAGFASARV